MSGKTGEVGNSADLLKDEQRKNWGAAAAAWERWWPVFEHAAGAFSRLMAQMARVGPGARVLDLATGIGEPALTLAGIVGPRGRVLATDHAPEMLELARKRAAAMGLDNVDFMLVDAAAPQLPAHSFDAVTCRWGLMFVPDVGDALKHIRGLIKPGCWFAAAVWASADKVPMISLSREEIDRALNYPARDPDAPDPLRLADIGALRSSFAEAGFSEVTSQAMTLPFEFATADDYVEFRRSVGAVAMARVTSPEQQAAVIEAMKLSARRQAEADGSIKLPSESICVAGRA